VLALLGRLAVEELGQPRKVSPEYHAATAVYWVRGVELARYLGVECVYETL